MCGRYRLSRRKQLVEEYFDCVSDEPDWSPRYNIAPTQPGMTHVAAASDLLKPYDAQQMRSYPVSTRINSVGNDDETCSEPVELADAQARLFS